MAEQTKEEIAKTEAADAEAWFWYRMREYYYTGIDLSYCDVRMKGTTRRLRLRS